MVTCLWIGAILQMLSNLAFTWLALVGTNHWALTVTIIVENFTGAIGTVIFVAYLSALCQSPLHTATQFALLTALAAVGRTYLSPAPASSPKRPAGRCSSWSASLVAIPSLFLLAWLQQRGHFDGLGADARRRARTIDVCYFVRRELIRKRVAVAIESSNSLVVAVRLVPVAGHLELGAGPRPFAGRARRCRSQL